MAEQIMSWGRTVRAPHIVARPHFRADLLQALESTKSQSRTSLAIGLGRSYGDSGLNPREAIIAMRGLNRIHCFDKVSGTLRADAGISLDELIKIVLPHGFFPPVVPGTRFVTLGGAVANDIHGKNHYTMGSFGCHVRKLSLLRTDGSRHELEPGEPSGLFHATIGGLGLTGVIEWAEIGLQRVAGAFLDAEDIPFGSLDEFFQIAADSEVTHEYTVAWVDCTQGGTALGRGIFSRARPSNDPERPLHHSQPNLAVPFELPALTMNALTLKSFNAVYFHLKKARARPSKVHYAPFFFPLDAIANWNRIYGRPGMYQYQCVLPPETARDATRELLSRIAGSGEGSFLAVLKTFGSMLAPGLLSFPREGATLALDFRNCGPRTLRLLETFDTIVHEAGGRLYPAKDGRMGPAMFKAGYPAYSTFMEFLDPGLSSGFWRRVMP